MSKKSKYRIRNWGQYNKSLVNRGSLTVWITDEIVNNLKTCDVSSAHGNQVHSDQLIELCLTLRQIYAKTLRATQGLMQSILTLMGLTITAPDYTTLSRRSRQLKIDLNAQANSKGRILLVDSTGVQVIGGTEWKKIRHKKRDKQLWRKLHIALDAENQDICAALMTESQRLDGNYLKPLVDSIQDDIAKLIGDGAYDKKSCYEVAYERNAIPVFPPQHNAIVQRNKIRKTPALLARDRLITYLNSGKSYSNRLSRWKNKQDYHQRSLVETTMSRLKHLFGDKLKSRCFENQVTDLMIRCKAINVMNQLGLPDSALAV